MGWSQPSLPDASKASYSQRELDQIGAYASWAVEGLRSGEALEAMDARRRVADEARPGAAAGLTGASPAFRNAFAQALLGEGLDDVLGVIEGEDTLASVNALLMAGSLAHRRSTGVLEVGLGDDREQVRIGAATGAQMMLTRLSVVEGNEARRWASEVQDAVASALRDEGSAVVARSLISALTSTPRVEVLQRGGLRRAATAMAERSRELAGEMSGAEAVESGWLAAQGKLIGELVTFLRGIGAGAAVDREMMREATFNVGAVMSMFGGTLEELALLDEEAVAEGGEGGRAQAFAGRYRLLMGATEEVGLQTEGLLLGRGIGDRRIIPALTDWFDAGAASADLGDFGVLDAVDSWVGSGGTLTEPPFGYESDEFEFLPGEGG